MKKKLLLGALAIVAAGCLASGTEKAFLREAYAENTTGCSVTTGRDDNEREYRVILTGAGVGTTLDKNAVKINEKSLTEWEREGKITQVYTGLAYPEGNGVRIDLPDYGENILKFDGTDTVTLTADFKVDDTAIGADYVQTMTEFTAPSISYGFETTGDVTESANGTLEFTPVFTAGIGSLRSTYVKCNDVELTPVDGKYTASFVNGNNTLEFYAENETEPNVFTKKTVTVVYDNDPVVEGPVYVSLASFSRNAEGRPDYKDTLTVRFSNVIAEADREKLSLSVNGNDLAALNAGTAWSADGRQVQISTLFFSESTGLCSGFYKYDGTDEIVVGGVTAENNVLKITSDGQVYNVTKGESAPAYKGTGYISVQRVAVEKGHEGRAKDAIHIFFNEAVSIRGSAAIDEGVLLFNTGTITINGQNLQAFRDANPETTAYWVDAAPNPYLRIDLFYENVSEALWDRAGNNTIEIKNSFITMTNLGLGAGAGVYTYDAEDDVVYEPGKAPESLALTLAEAIYLKACETGNDWIQLKFNENAWPTANINIQGNTRITDNIVINGKSLTEWKEVLKKLEIHAGADGANVLRMTISADGDFETLFKKDGTDTFVVKEGLGLNKYVSVKADQSVPGVADATAPALTLSENKTVNETAYEVEFTASDDSAITITVTHNGQPVSADEDGKYRVTLSEGENIFVVGLEDASFFKNATSGSYTVVYEEIPVITYSGVENNSCVSESAVKLTASASVGSITSVALNGNEVALGSDSRYALVLSEGENEIIVEATNGSTKASEKIVVTLDSVAPVITLSVEDGTTVDSPDFEFTVELSEAGTVVVKLNGSSLTAVNEMYAATLEEGENEISVTAFDEAGNMSSKKITVTYVKESEGDSSDSTQTSASSSDADGGQTSASSSDADSTQTSASSSDADGGQTSVSSSGDGSVNTGCGSNLALSVLSVLALAGCVLVAVKAKNKKEE